MGIKASLYCCSLPCTNITQEDTEEKENDDLFNTQKIPVSFRSNYTRSDLFSKTTSFLVQADEEKVDFISQENRIMQCSAIIGSCEIPSIPELI